MSRRALLLTALLGALAVAGCGDDDGGSAGAGAALPPGAKAVEIKDITFEPETIELRVGQTVRWTNADAIAHNVTAEKGADFASDNLDSGDTFDWKAGKPGRVHYVCTIHPGQEGDLVVAP